MSGSDILNQDEIDALLHGVDSGAVKGIKISTLPDVDVNVEGAI